MGVAAVVAAVAVAVAVDGAVLAVAAATKASVCVRNETRSEWKWWRPPHDATHAQVQQPLEVDRCVGSGRRARGSASLGRRAGSSVAVKVLGRRAAVKRGGRRC
eukprot:5086298-Prymnesium_polylepis.2